MDSDYIELDTLRGTQLSPPQQHDLLTRCVQHLRSAHAGFIYKIYLFSLIMVLGVSMQWWFLTEIKLVHRFVILYNYVLLVVIFLHFLLLTFLQYVLRHKESRSKSGVIIYIIVLVEFGSITIARQIVDSKDYTLLYAALLVLVIFGTSLILAFINHKETDRKPAHLSLWSQKMFLTTTVCLFMTKEFSVAEVQIGISLFMMFFLAIFFIIWVRSLGSAEFFKTESSYLGYYIVLNYLNILAFFENALVFFQKIKDVT